MPDVILQQIPQGSQAPLTRDHAHRLLPHVCACGCWLTGFTQTMNGHDTVYAHCTNAACPDYYNTQELTFYLTDLNLSVHAEARR